MKILVIKPVAPKQISAVLELDRLCFGGLWNADGYLREVNSPNSTLLALSLSNPPGQIRQKDYDSRIIGIGCLWAIVEEAHITLLGIHPEYRGQKLGQLLLCILLENALKRNLSRATLEVSTNNQQALSLYQKLGFRTAGRRRKYYSQTGEDALILWRSGLDRVEFSQNLTSWKQSSLESLSAKYDLSQLVRISNPNS